MKLIFKFFNRARSKRRVDSTREVVINYGRESAQQKSTNFADYADLIAEAYLGNDKTWQDMGATQKNEALELFRIGLHLGN